MIYDNEYDFFEPSEEQIVLDEVCDIFKKMVRQEVQDELASLRKQNAELREFRDNKSKYEREFASVKRDCANKIAQAENKAKQMRIHSLLGDNFTVGYMVYRINTRPPKCNKCDEHRRVEFKSPLGRTFKEDCECSKYTVTYAVKEVELMKFYIRQNSNPNICRYYKHADDVYNDKEDCNEYDYVTRIYNNEPFEDVRYYSTVFLDKDECQAYCDWKNTQQND